MASTVQAKARPVQAKARPQAQPVQAKAPGHLGPGLPMGSAPGQFRPQQPPGQPMGSSPGQFRPQQPYKATASAPQPLPPGQPKATPPASLFNQRNLQLLLYLQVGCFFLFCNVLKRVICSFF